MTRYPLAAPLALRARDEEGARATLAEALAWEASRAQDREARATRASDATGRWRGAELASLAGGGGEAGGFLSRARFASRLRAEAARLADAVRAGDAILQDARAEVEKRRRSLAAARSASKALERHRDAWRVARSRAALQREQDELDEAVSALRGAP